MAITRRKFLVQASAVGALAVTTGNLHGETVSPASIRETASSRGILAGCAVAVNRLRDDPAYAELVRSQAGIVVAENSFKFGKIHPTPTKYFFDDADYLVAFAEKHNMKLRGHNFVWHRALPQEFDSFITPQNAEKVLVEHIEQVAGRYAGRIQSWDVVNEAISPKDGLPNGMRNTIWQRVLPNYMEIAFRTARRVDPKALLVYNDYGIEADDGDSSKKRRSVIEMLQDMKQRGVPIDGLGIQSHINAASSHVYGNGLRSLIATAKGMGLTVLLTEMDVNDRDLPADIPTRDVAVSKAYGNYLKVALEDIAVIALLTWGITDRYTWLNGEDSRKDRLLERPLPFDRDLKAKPAYDATISALSNAPRR